MIHIRNPDDLQLITDPELQREVHGYLSYCIAEFLEYEDEEDMEDFNFLVLSVEDLPMLNELGPPEETVQISIKTNGIVLTIYRIVYVTEVIFIPTEISDQVSF